MRLVLAVALLGCTAPAPAREPVLLAEPLAPGEIVLDQRADGARIVGTIEPVRPNTDAERVVAIRAIAAELEPMRALDARFAADGIVTIGTDHVLCFHRRGAIAQLDTEVYGPISVAGSRVAYVTGAAPLLELARADVSTGQAITLTSGMSPAWSPALTPDGRSIVFVSGVSGTPRFYRVDGEGPPRALAPTARTPGSPIGPRFEGDLLRFDDELGTAWLDLAEGRIVREEP